MRTKNEILIAPLCPIRREAACTVVIWANGWCGMQLGAMRFEGGGICLEEDLWLVLVVAGAGLSARSALAQEDLNRGKTPAQLFASDCADCHRNPRALAQARECRCARRAFCACITPRAGKAPPRSPAYLASLGPDPRAGSARPATQRSRPAASRRTRASPTQTRQPAAPARRARTRRCRLSPCRQRRLPRRPASLPASQRPAPPPADPQ